jgi:hypothetical protein
MNVKVCGWMWSWPNFKYSPVIFLNGLNKTAKTLSRESWSAGGSLNPVPQQGGRILTKST